MTIRFDADVDNGAIPLPSQIKHQLSGCKRLHVTIVADEASRSDEESDIIEELMRNSPPFEGPFLTRDEIYDRKL